ncbi:uncharacterized protein P884DRAFT_262710 [Thermothelomyces heterothallicus CBS 202.75]|uniref:uncharacterized protein n=1 Tax=Thermothelomyces heterothallicus CBS 202.75 TaxID=1149848 RepID=UPI003742E976
MIKGGIGGVSCLFLLHGVVSSWRCSSASLLSRACGRGSSQLSLDLVTLLLDALLNPLLLFFFLVPSFFLFYNSSRLPGLSSDKIP